MFRQVRVRSFSQPTASLQPGLIERQPQTRPRNDGCGDPFISIPFVRLMHAQASVAERMRTPLQGSINGKLRRNNSHDWPERNLIRNRNSVGVAARERMQRSFPRAHISAACHTSKLRKVRPHEQILLGNRQIPFAYEPSRRHEKRSEEFALLRFRLPRLHL